MSLIDSGKLTDQLQKHDGKQPLSNLYVVIGNEILLVNETIDAIRKAATKSGYTERISLELDSRSDWSAVTSETQSISLFGDKKLITISIPSGKPGRVGGKAIQELAEQSKTFTDIIVIVVLPRLDRASKNSAWFKSLLSIGSVVEHKDITRAQLPSWISQRMALQGQSTDQNALNWMADKVEGNLLAAHQEVLKLGMLYDKGNLDINQVQEAVLDVARYNVFNLRDAMLTGNANRALSILDGLKSEGTALPLVLWAVGGEIRTLAILDAARTSGTLNQEIKRQRIFYNQEQYVMQALNRVPSHIWPLAVAHAHDIDKIIKGLNVAGRLNDPWTEVALLILRVANSTN